MRAAHEVERELHVGRGDWIAIRPACVWVDAVVNGFVGVILGPALGESRVNSARDVGMRVQKHGLSVVQQVATKSTRCVGTEVAEGAREIR